MDKKRKEWSKKYEVKITEKPVSLTNHVRRIIPYDEKTTDTFDELNHKSCYIGLDGTKKTYKQLTDEEKLDIERQDKEFVENFDGDKVVKETLECLKKISEQKEFSKLEIML